MRVGKYADKSVGEDVGTIIFDVQGMEVSKVELVTN